MRFLLSDNIRAPLRIYLGRHETQRRLTLELIIVIVLLLLLFGSLPIFPYSRGWGYRGSGGLGTILLIVIILWALGYV